jgi:hypothetical protein
MTNGDDWEWLWNAGRLLLAILLGCAGLLALLFGALLVDWAYNGFCFGLAFNAPECSAPKGFDTVLLRAPILAATLFLCATRLVRLRWLTSVIASLTLPVLLLLWIVVGAT